MRIAVLLGFLFASMLTSGTGQNAGDGNLVGDVTDTYGSALPGVRIRVVRNDTGDAISTTADDAGRYKLSTLAPGGYTITAESFGFGTKSLRVEIQPAQTQRLDIEMDEPRVPMGDNCPSGPDVGSPIQPVGARDFVRLELSYEPEKIYSVQVRGDGSISWQGADHFLIQVQTKGNQEATIEPEVARALIERYRTPEFWSLCARYESTGNPLNPGIRRYTNHGSTVTTTVRIADREKTVANYGETGPTALKDLEREIRLVTDTHRWIHTDSKIELFSATNLTEDSSFVNKAGVTALMRASGTYGSFRKAQAQLASGADPNERDSSGWTALMYAAVSGKADVIQALLSAGANSNLRSEMGQTALMAAAFAPRNNVLNVTRSLIAAGADVNAQDWNGQTALMLAARSRIWQDFPERMETLAALYAAGARTDSVDARGQTVFDHLDLAANEPGANKPRYEQMKAVLRSPVPGSVAVRVAGRVVTPANSALREIVLRRVGAGIEDVQAQVARDGTFEFPKVLPGTYTVQPLPAPAFPIAPVTVNVASQETIGLEIALPALREVVLRVAVDGRGPAPGVTLALAGNAGGINHALPALQHRNLGAGSPLPENIATALVGGADVQFVQVGLHVSYMDAWSADEKMSAVDRRQSDGAYPLILPDGEYAIAAIIPTKRVSATDRPKAAFSIKSITHGATDLRAKPLVISPTDSSELRLVIAPAESHQWIKVGGQVFGLEKEVLARAKIRIEGEVMGLESRVNEDGSFEFPQVFPEDFTLRVLSEDVPPSAGRDALERATLAHEYITSRSVDTSNLEIDVWQPDVVQNLTPERAEQ